MDMERVDLAVKSHSFTIVRVFLTALMIKSTMPGLNNFKLLVATTFLAFGGNIIVSALLSRPNVLVYTPWNMMILITCSICCSNQIIYKRYNRSLDWIRSITSCFSSGYAMAQTMLELKSNPLFKGDTLVPQLILITLSGGGGGLLHSWFIKGNQFQINGFQIKIITLVSIILLVMNEYGLGSGDERLIASLGIYSLSLLESGFNHFHSSSLKPRAPILVPKGSEKAPAQVIEQTREQTPIKEAQKIKQETGQTPIKESRKIKLEEHQETSPEKVKSPTRTRARSKRLQAK